MLENSWERSSLEGKSVLFWIQKQLETRKNMDAYFLEEVDIC